MLKQNRCLSCSGAAVALLWLCSGAALPVKHLPASATLSGAATPRGQSATSAGRLRRAQVTRARSPVPRPTPISPSPALGFAGHMNGSPRGMGHVVNVKVKDPSGEWISLYAGAALKDESASHTATRKYWQWAPNLC